MKRVDYSKYGYNEYIFNNSKLRKLYQMYLHQTVFDKILDFLVVFAIFFTLIEVSSHIFFKLPEFLHHFFASFTVLIFLIFGLELFREYAHCRDHKHFFRKHGIDFFLVVFLSLYFFAGAYFGLAKIKVVAETSKYLAKFKELKIISKIGSLKF